MGDAEREAGFNVGYRQGRNDENFAWQMRVTEMTDPLHQKVAALEAELAAARARIGKQAKALRELIEMVIPATGVEVTPETRAATRAGLMAYLNLTDGDLDDAEGA